MILTLDNLAHRYMCLPSEALARASTFDLYVLDVSTKWENYRNDRANGKVTAKKHLDQADLLAMMQVAKNLNDQRLKEQQ
jgi:hypothetical protein